MGRKKAITVLKTIISHVQYHLKDVFLKKFLAFLSSILGGIETAFRLIFSAFVSFFKSRDYWDQHVIPTLVSLAALLGSSEMLGPLLPISWRINCAVSLPKVYFPIAIRGSHKKCLECFRQPQLTQFHSLCYQVLLLITSSTGVCCFVCTVLHECENGNNQTNCPTSIQKAEDLILPQKEQE